MIIENLSSFSVSTIIFMVFCSVVSIIVGVRFFNAEGQNDLLMVVG
jgi:hypothetical protein